jgi:predicted dehydrogenase
MNVPLRIGTLGAARITPMALLRPARQVPEATIVAIAARDAQRAQAFATKHAIPRVHASYEALIADPEIEAIYNPLPNSHHREWTIKALEAGKHVLCEKPLAANAEEAQAMVDVAARSGRVLMEAFHWRYHPLAARMKQIVDSGELGTVRHVEAHFCIPLWVPGDIRYRLDLAGGATMDTGCYAISITRFLAGAEPDVVRAEAKLSSPGVDRYMTADFRFPDGRTGRIVCALLSAIVFRARARVFGDLGEMTVLNPVVPQFFHRLKVTTTSASRSEHVRGDATYTHQLRAFVAAVRDGTPFPTDGAHGVANMRVIDAIYRKAGLQPRGLG